MQKNNIKTPSFFGQLVRMAVLFVLFFVVIALIFGEPASQEHWGRTFIWSKVIGLCVGYIAYKLLIYWDSKGLIPDFGGSEENEESKAE